MHPFASSLLTFVVLSVVCFDNFGYPGSAQADETENVTMLHLNLRGKPALHAAENVQADTKQDSSTTKVEWRADRTALIICDMWDDHWCKGAAARVAEMAKPLNKVVASAREKGVLIIHAPSSVVDFYKDTPQRKMAIDAPHADSPVPLSTKERWGTNWCWPDPKREKDLPIDDSDMGCDCKVKCELREAWSRQIDTIELVDGDALTHDGQEVVNLLAQHKIDNVILCGVHLNMCVLGRPFGIRQMVNIGKNVALMRDMTDTMYNSQKRPQVSHFEGTALVVDHIERYWCPSFESIDIIGGKPFKFAGQSADDGSN